MLKMLHIKMATQKFDKFFKCTLIEQLTIQSNKIVLNEGKDNSMLLQASYGKANKLLANPI